jgi:REP element-mobilizing transposase RayT
VTYPRSHLVDRENAGFYHVFTRCVRRAWLCGRDPVTGRSYDHRRQWIEDRILALAECFTVEIYGYAVMSNHYHIALYIDPKGPNALSDAEVARRWVTLSPPIRRRQLDQVAFEMRVEALSVDPDQLAIYRQRLGDLSWFMRFLNENIARRANLEDGCKGRFWERRFESQTLLDERAVYACMAYVDLNPIRAGMATDLEKSDHTSIQRRIRQERRAPSTEHMNSPLAPLSAGTRQSQTRLTISLEGYLDLVDWTGRIIRDDKTGAIPQSVPRLLRQLSMDVDDWLPNVTSYRDHHRRAFGSIEALRALASRLGQHWLKGSGAARLRPAAI